MKIGIPRALFYHYYFPFWQAYFRELGVSVIVSPPTNKSILNKGVRAAVDEACLPVKIFLGHALTLGSTVDALFVPRLVSVEAKSYICPKFMGLPDMLRAVSGMPQIIDPTVNFSTRKEPLEVAELLALRLGHSRRQGRRAFEVARNHHIRFRRMLKQGILPFQAMENLEMEKVTEEAGTVETALPEITPCVIILGHGYNLYDPLASMGLLTKLEQLGARVVTADRLSGADVERLCSQLPKRMFWTLGKRLLAGLFEAVHNPEIKGIIQLTSFGCGPESLVGDLIDRYCRRLSDKPYMLVTVDEHTGEAGVYTRLEAFMDMVVGRILA